MSFFGERCEFDARDQAILDKRVVLLNEARAKHGPRVGDFVLFPGEDIRRFTHDWGDSIQTTVEAQASLLWRLRFLSVRRWL